MTVPKILKPILICISVFANSFQLLDSKMFIIFMFVCNEGNSYFDLKAFVSSSAILNINQGFPSIKKS